MTIIDLNRKLQFKMSVIKSLRELYEIARKRILELPLMKVSPNWSLL